MSISLFDILITSIYAVLFFVLFYRFYPDSENAFKPQIMLGMLVKVLGSFVFTWIYTSYYDIGDAIIYFNGASEIREVILTDLHQGFRLLGLAPGEETAAFGNPMDWYEYYEGSSEWTFARLASIVNLFCLDSFLALCLCFSMMAFVGLSLIFLVFARKYPAKKWMLFGLVFLSPSCFLWTSGLLKDTLCLGLVGLVFYFIHSALIRSFSLWKIIAAIIGLWLIWTFKVYLASAFMFSLAIWILLHFMTRTGSLLQQRILRLGLTILLIAGAYYLPKALMIANEHQVYKESVQKIQTFQEVYGRSENQNDSKYQVKIPDFTPYGILTSAPMGVTTAICRPFLWEARKPVLMLLSLENLLYTIGIFMVLFRLFFIHSSRQWILSPEGMFSLVFVLMLALIVGITCSNYGLLMRVRTPYLPFLGVWIVLGLTSGMAKKTAPSKPDLPPG